MKSKNKLSKKVVFSLLLAIILFHAVNNYIVIKNNKAPLFHDSGDLLFENWRVYNLMSEGKFDLKDYLKNDLECYPTFLCTLLFPYYKIFGTSVNAIIMTNIFFLIILIFSIYKIGKMLHSRRAGILAAFIINIFPQVFGFSRDYDLRYHLIAIITLAIYFLLKTNRFTSLKNSIYLGLACGFATTIKLEAFIYIAGPFCILLYNSFFQNRKLIKLKQIKYKIRNLIIFSFSFCLGLIISGGLCLDELKRILLMLSEKVDSSSSIFFYLKSLISNQILYYFSILFFISIIYFLFIKKKDKLFLFSWYFLPFLLYTFILTDYIRMTYMMLSLPAVALMISIFLCSIKKNNVKAILIILTILIGVGQFFVISYLPEFYPYIEKVNSKLCITQIQPGVDSDLFYYSKEHGSFIVQTQFIGFLHSYKHDWGINEMSNIINKAIINKSKPVFIRVHEGNIAPQITQPLSYNLFLKGIKNYEIISVLNNSMTYHFRNTYESESLNTYKSESLDYYFFEILDNSTINYLHSEYLNKTVLNIQTYYELIGNITLPNKMNVYIYKK